MTNWHFADRWRWLCWFGIHQWQHRHGVALHCDRCDKVKYP